ncbi:MAG TPA: aldehyde dehydrogenase family protein, partial [Thermodesulfovibrionales bacterium]|nr:aldehyde dehydrogenase family protein [Thermodesulfovibrionales bacterium]
MKPVYPILLGGRPKETNKTIDILNPYNDQTVSKVCRAASEDLQQAIAIAHNRSTDIGSLPSHKKAEILRTVSDSIRQRRDDLAKAITLENGKPIHESRTEADRASLTFQIAAEEASRIGGEFIALDRNRASEGRWGITKRFPCGTVFGITPFNFPLNLVAHKIAPAIASGNPIIIKPASKTPITALLLGDILMESGLPEGCLSVLPCTGELAETAVTDQRVKVLSFTGSATVGWALKRLAYDKKVILELGGNAGVLLDRDCNLDFAVDRCVAGAFSYAGQVCISVQRIYAHKDIHDDFLERFIAKVKMLKTGDPLDDETLIGPMIDEDNRKRVETWVQEAMASGARIATGGKRRGNLYEPTIVLDATPQMKLNCMEVFAPVVTVTRIESFEAGLKAVNDSAYGLQAGVFTNNLQHAFTAFNTLEVGSVIINDVPAYRVDHMPYG